MGFHWIRSMPLLCYIQKDVKSFAATAGYSQGNQHNFLCISCVVFLMTEAWNFTVLPCTQHNRKILSKDECLGCKKIKICEHKITGPVVWEDKIAANI